MAGGRDDRIEHVALVVFLGLLIAGCLVVLRPFLTALLWALILSISTWPTFKWFERRLGGRRSAAAGLMTLLLFAVLLLPFFVIGTTVAENLKALPEQFREVIAAGLPGPPSWLVDVPVVGQRASMRWYEYSLDPPKLAEAARQYVRPVTEWLLGFGARLGGGVLELALSVLAAFFFYRDGEAGVKTLQALGERLGGVQARRLIEIAGETMKAVVYGILGGALAQGVLTTVGLYVVGAPTALFLGAVAFVFSIVPPGPVIVWGPVAIWLFVEGETGWGVFLVVWGFAVVGSVDNFLRPYFISRGSALPLLLVFLGVLGGVLAFGLLGIFIGPTLLAVGYTVLTEWTRRAREKAAGAAAPPG
jgi:predicted PurR-regulated permease PerM